LYASVFGNNVQGGEELNNDNEVGKALCRLFTEIAKREKDKAVKADDYAAAFIAAMLEGVFKDAELSIPSSN
jgi:hypothetical protein